MTMNKIVYEKYGECYYEGVCDNGLKVVVFPKPDFITTACGLAVKYGSVDLSQDINGEIVRFPAGVAHFLEHKLFESDQEDIMTKFVEMGANVNAYTSFYQTCYHFDTSEKDITEPLKLLLSFVQHLDISEESVEKEKGIIVEEYEMYRQRPDSRLLNELTNAIYHNFDIKEDIAGDRDSINSITKEVLEKAYLYNYHPDKMMLVVAGPQDPQAIFDLVQETQKDLVYDVDCAKTLKVEEPLAVAKELKVVNMDVLKPKVAIGIKLNLDHLSEKEIIVFDWSLRLLLATYFTSRNEEFQKWIDDKDISAMFYYENDIMINQGWIIFMDDTDNPERFNKFINEQLVKLKEIDIDESLFERLKKKYFGSAMIEFDNVSSIMNEHIRLQENNLNNFELLEIINGLSAAQAMEFYRSLDISNQSMVVIKSE